MKSLRFLALLLLFFTSTFFTYLAYGQELKKDVKFELVPPTSAVEKGREIAIGVKMHNPSKQNVVSFLTVLKYDEKMLKGLRVEPPQPSLYDINLYANDETAFLHDKGIVRMGRATIADISSQSDPSIFLGTFIFQVLETPKKPLEFQLLNNSSLTQESSSANINKSDTIENILDVSTLQPLSVSLSSGEVTPVTTTEPTPVKQDIPMTAKPTPSQNDFATVSIESVTEEVPLENVPKMSENGPYEQAVLLFIASLVVAFLFHSHFFTSRNSI